MERVDAMSIVDAVQIELDRKVCPSTMECNKQVTSDYFNTVCSRKHYAKCHRYNEMMRTLRTPCEWVVETAPMEM